MTEKENYMRLYEGKKPEWVPRMYYTSPGRAPACVRVTPSFLNAGRTPDGGGRDIWGLEFTGVPDLLNQAVPTPGKVFLPDVTKWRDVLHAPDLSQYDFDKMAEQDLANINRNETAVMFGLHNGYFQAIVNMMGYVDGCCAFYEEPDEVKAMLGYMCDFHCAVLEKVLKYYKPDIFNITDDIASKLHPFISLDMYQEFILPFTEREAAIARAAGLPIDMHCCGACTDFIDDWIKMGVRSWQPAQVMNNLHAVREKFPDLIFTGCWDSQGPAGLLSTPEKETREYVRKCIDEYAPDGKFIFWASNYGNANNPEFQAKMRWVQEEYDSYGRTFYQSR